MIIITERNGKIKPIRAAVMCAVPLSIHME